MYESREIYYFFFSYDWFMVSFNIFLLNEWDF